MIVDLIVVYRGKRDAYANDTIIYHGAIIRRRGNLLFASDINISY